MLQEVETRIRAHSYRFTCERDLQDGIAAVLSGLPLAAEYRLNATDRLDFFIDGLALEVKIDGSLSALTRQVHRYAQHPDVTAVLVVTSLPRLDRLPPVINHKPVRVVVVYHP